MTKEIRGLGAESLCSAESDPFDQLRYVVGVNNVFVRAGESKMYSREGPICCPGASCKLGYHRILVINRHQ